MGEVILGRGILGGVIGGVTKGGGNKLGGGRVVLVGVIFRLTQLCCLGSYCGCGFFWKVNYVRYMAGFMDRENRWPISAGVKTATTEELNFM